MRNTKGLSRDRKNNSVWITWSDHRRSRELAHAFGAEYWLIERNSNRLLRYLLLPIPTIARLLKYRPNIVFCQNPSIFLCLILCWAKNIFGYKLITDRHSNFNLEKIADGSVFWRLWGYVGDYTLRRADLTIVTNQILANYISQKGGQGVVLPDKLPTINGKTIALNGKHSFLFICSYASDEPYCQLISAFSSLGENFHCYITGNYKRRGISLGPIPNNVTLTGYVSEDNFQNLLASVDCVIVITDRENLLTCGAYEAVAAEKPFITGTTKSIQEYFYKGALRTKSDQQSIAATVLDFVTEEERLKAEVFLLKQELNTAWAVQFKLVVDIINKA